MNYKKSIQHIDCIHKQVLVNQGIEFCSIGLDCSKCEECTSKESQDIEVISSWASMP